MATKKQKWAIGSHNSLSYMKPRKWWMKLLKFTAKCQKASLHDQFWKYGVRMFDIRIKFDEYGFPVICHGIIEYKTIGMTCTLLTLNDWANSIDEKVYVRLILEENKEQIDQEFQDKCFIDYCKDLEKGDQYNCGNIIFIGGVRKYDWKQLYKFKAGTGDNLLDDKYSSTTSFFKSKCKLLAILDDWFPWLYARTHNKKNIKAGTNKKFLFIDFVNIQ